ncbi:hypothetical protein AK812_SmicGene45131 [Symbiodinium microadriaticum]|uniref:Uncharacterized protein n=1 Tax=Symbiodinium microadriaticum TaxID=2951 RepID=A0A1Q9BWP4_SYMMI|nr:hypothetical protein AK812_SmicGene45131 [Symbiodinium microadriaticum]
MGPVFEDYFDVNPTFKFIMQHARQLFPQAHIAHWGADTKLWEQETNLIVQHLKATVELIRGLRPEKYVDDFETDNRRCLISIGFLAQPWAIYKCFEMQAW